MHRNMHFSLWFRRMLEPAAVLFYGTGLGLFLGTFCAARVDFVTLSWMRQTLSCPVSIVSFVAVQVLPFLFAAHAAFISNSIPIYAICFGKMFCFSFVGFLVSVVFGSAGWLVRLLCLFSDICIAPLFIWFCLRAVTNADLKHKDLRICLTLVVAIVLLDGLLIAPFMAKLM